MLTHILVKDLAIVSGLELDLGAGMTALTGETGAGKSILIDALGLVLGDKADAQLVRTGCKRAEIIAGFDLRASLEARDWLAGQDLDAGDECLGRRLLMRQGRSRAYINGHPATGVQLQGLGERLVDIHGQHAHQSLLRAAHQRDLLDDYGGTDTLAAQVADRYRAYREHDQRLERLRTESADRAARLELLRYQVEELADLGLNAAAIRELDQEQKRLANLGELQGTTGRLLQRLYEDEPSLHAELSHAGADLETLSGLDERLSATRELVAGAAIQVEEAAANLRRYLDESDLDPGLLEQVEQRLTQVHDLARKYRVPPDRIPETLQAMRAELDALERDDMALETLAAEHDRARAALLTAAEALSDARSRTAQRLSETVTKAMQGLGMGGRTLRGGSHQGPARGGHCPGARPGGIPGQRQSGPAHATPGEGGLRGRAVPDQPRPPGRHRRVRRGADPGLRRSRCGDQRRRGRDRRQSAAHPGRGAPGPLRHPPAPGGGPGP